MKRGIFAVLMLVGCVSVQAADWPQWRGPTGDGVWSETGVVNDLKDLSVRWRQKVSNGYSGCTVANGRVFLMDRVTDPNEAERILCFDAKDGTALWSESYPCKYEKVGYPDGPRASVIVDSGRAYALGAMGHLHCIDVKKGKVAWKTDLKSEYRITIPIWGIAASPLIYQDLVILHIGGEGACILALDKVTGKEVWRALDDKASYSTPIVIEQAGKPVLVCWTGDSIAGLNPKTGECYWQEVFTPVRMVMNIAAPVYANGYLFLSSFFDGSYLYKLDPDKLAITKVWRRVGKNERVTDALHCCISTPMMKGDYIYGVDSYGELRCLDVLTGDRVWEGLDAVKKDRWANVHMVQNGEHTWMFNEQGELIISKLSKVGFQEISRAKIIEPTVGQLKRSGNKGVCWSHPAFAGRCVYVRNDNELVCVDLSARMR